MKSKLLWLIVAAGVVLGLALYWADSDDNLNVTPDARRAIEKAKRR